MTPFSAVVGGGGAGLIGALLAHVLTVACGRLGSEAWLRGSYGPPFFDVALYTGVFYGAIGAAAGRPAPRGRAATAALGFLGTFLGIAAPMFALTRYGGWGMPRTANAVTPQWQVAVLAVYVLAIWGTIAGLGAAATLTKRRRGALAAVLGSLAGYAVLSLVLKLLPGYETGRWNPTGWLPSPVNLLDGLLSGAGLCLALTLDKLWTERTTT